MISSESTAPDGALPAYETWGVRPADPGISLHLGITFRSMDAMTLTREEAVRRLRSIEADVRRLGVRRLALFGSVARDESTSTSDVDVLVEFAPGQKSFDRFMALAELLEETLGRRVELVTTEALSPFIGPHILAEAMDVVRAA